MNGIINDTGMKRAGYWIMLIAICLILLGGIVDIAYTFSVESIIPSHLDYLELTGDEVSPKLRNLDLALIRGIGGFIIAIAIGSLALLRIFRETGNPFILWVILIMITIGEGNNFLQMILLDSPFYVAPLFFLIIVWAGGLISLIEKRGNS